MRRIFKVNLHVFDFQSFQKTFGSRKSSVFPTVAASVLYRSCYSATIALFKYFLKIPFGTNTMESGNYFSVNVFFKKDKSSAASLCSLIIVLPIRYKFNGRAPKGCPARLWKFYEDNAFIY